MWSIAWVLQAGYITAAASILLLRSTPALRDRLLAYGARESTSSPGYGRTATQAVHKDVGSVARHSLMDRMLNILARLRVPHSWFITFYGALLVSLVFWAALLVLGGPAWQWILMIPFSERFSMTIPQVLLTWSLLVSQGARRLMESITFQKSTRSTMFIGHWLMGLAFYLTISIAIWAEAIPQLQSTPILLSHLRLQAPSLRSFSAILVFILASGVQHDCHAYLASLQAYAVPRHPIFAQVVCPHYLAECVIYLALALVAAPSGHFFNRTIFSAFVFVVVNLGVTADGTRTWYADKFGADAVLGKWRMIPWLF